ncbi:MAG: hypothetical protein U0T73_08835 [Chitinophagales bacterium]
MKKHVFTTAAAVFAIVLLFSSCKKETVTPDDPNIVYKSLNKTINTISGAATIDSLDLNNDGVSEIYVQFINSGADTGGVVFTQFAQQIGFVAEGISPAPYAKLFHSGDMTPSSASVYYSTVYPVIKVSGYRLALQSGEGYLAFRFSTGTKFSYGWMKISVNTSLTELKILEYAYSIVPDTPIAVGAK